MDGSDLGSTGSVRTRDEGGRSGGLRRRLGRVFSLRAFLLALFLSLVGLVAGSLVPLVGGLVSVVGRYAGLFLAAFAVGLWSDHRRYLEVGLAGAVASALGFVLTTLTASLFPIGVRFLADYGGAVAGVGAGAGFLIALAGHYFGRDFRDGLTRTVD